MVGRAAECTVRCISLVVKRTYVVLWFSEYVLEDSAEPAGLGFSATKIYNLNPSFQIVEKINIYRAFISTISYYKPLETRTQFYVKQNLIYI